MRRQRIFRSMMLSYLAIALIPFVFLALSIVRQANQYYESALMDRGRSEIERIEAVLDVRMMECRAMAYQIGESTMLFAAELSQSARIESIRKLDEMRAGNQFVQSITLWQRETPTVYSTRGMMSKDVYLKSYLGMDITAGEMQARIEQANGALLVYGARNSSILYVAPCRATSTNDISVIFSFDGEGILRMLAKGDPGTADYALLLDHHRQVVYHNLPAGIDAPAIALAEFVRVGDTAYRVLRTGAGGTLTLRTLVPDKDFAISVGDIALTIGLTILLMACCVGLSAWLASVNFRPVRKLGDMVGEDGKRYDTWEQLHQDVYRTIRQNQVYIETITAQRRQLLEDYLARLIHGYTDPAEEGSMREKMELPSGPLHCRVACMRIGQMPRGPRWRGFMQIFNERKTRQEAALEIERENIIALIFLLEEAETADVVQRRCGNFFPGEEGLQGVRVGIGRDVRNLTDIRTSYLQALAALQGMPECADEKLSFLCFDDLVREQEPLPNLKEQEIYLELALHQGDRRLACEALDEMMRGATDAPHAQAHYIGYRLIEIVMPLFEETFGKAEAAQVMKALTEEVNASRIGDFRALLMRKMEEICAERNRRSEASSDRIRLEVLACVHEMFTDSVLSLEYLADRFGFSRYYWSRYFKEIIGQNFSDYVWALRLQRAKELLPTTLTVSEVTERVGYIDARSFSRKFKNSLGVTPAQYKRNTGNQTDSPEEKEADPDGPASDL